ncbi:MAG: hypothetical protein Q8P50_13345, partial [Bacillota bacterium]|nr:hypothetical protein [Bacillota bacterium]
MTGDSRQLLWATTGLLTIASAGRVECDEGPRAGPAGPRDIATKGRLDVKPIYGNQCLIVTPLKQDESVDAASTR